MSVSELITWKKVIKFKQTRSRKTSTKKLPLLLRMCDGRGGGCDDVGCGLFCCLRFFLAVEAKL